MSRYVAVALSTVSLLFISLFAYSMTVGSNDIKKNAVLSKHIQNNNVKSSDIKNNNVKGKDIRDGTIEAVDLADGAVSTAKLQDEVVTTNKVMTGAITTSEIADGAVTSSKLAAAAITMPFSVYAFGDQDERITTVDEVVRSVTLVIPADGIVVVSASANIYQPTANDGAICSLTTGAAIDFDMAHEWISGGKRCDLRDVSHDERIRCECWRYANGKSRVRLQRIHQRFFAGVRLRYDRNLHSVALRKHPPDWQDSFRGGFWTGILEAGSFVANGSNRPTFFITNVGFRGACCQGEEDIARSPPRRERRNSRAVSVTTPTQPAAPVTSFGRAAGDFPPP